MGFPIPLGLVSLRGEHVAEFMSMETAELIEQGMTFLGAGVEEKPNVFLEQRGALFSAGALGLAMIGKSGGPRRALKEWSRVSNSSPAKRLESAAEFLGITIALARMVELNHRNGVAANGIANALRGGSLAMAVQNVTTRHAKPLLLVKEFDRRHVDRFAGGSDLGVGVCRP